MNILCGFGALDLALASIEHEEAVRIEIFLSKIKGQNLPKETYLNVAGMAGLTFLEKSAYHGGIEIEIEIEIEIYKKINLEAA